MLTPIFFSTIFYTLIFLFISGSLGALLFKKNDEIANIVGNVFAIAGSFFGLILSGSTLLSGTATTLDQPSTFPMLNFTFSFDPLSTFFMFIISLISLVCSIYAIGYVSHYYKKYSIGVLGFFYNLFILSMILVATAHNALLFLIVWELMSLASYFLVIYERREATNIKAGSLYFMMTHIGTAFIIFSFLLMYSSSGSFDFTVIKNSLINTSPLIQSLIFLSALIGFGTKAGIIPFHIWLPNAHPAAPSHVSALMSGVMIKTGIYMLIRISLDLLPNTPMWWGITVLIIGAVSSLLGVLYALAEHNLKKLLAYHSIENIGIILLGLGSSLVFASAGLYSLAIIGLIASLYHTINHAIFKALLFLGAGSVIAQTHTKNIEEYGGLIKYMPQTAFFFLIGSMAISALPPFNGFFSEWLTFQALFHGIASFDFLPKFAFILSAGALAFTGGLAAACFVKAFGATFLARPRSEEVSHAKESSLSLKIGMASLALLTVIFGAFAGSISGLLEKVAGSVIKTPQTAIQPQFISISIQNSFSTISMPMILALITLATIITSGVIFLITKKQKVSIDRTWNCGTDLTPRMEITATGFSKSFITVFKDILKPTKETETEYHDEESNYFPKVNAITLELKDIYIPYLYQPINNLTIKIADKIKRVQIGHISAYILYIFVTLIGILFVLAF